MPNSLNVNIHREVVVCCFFFGGGGFEVVAGLTLAYMVVEIQHSNSLTHPPKISTLHTKPAELCLK